MKKIKFASQDKTDFKMRICSISKCGKQSLVIIPLGNEQRRLCKGHVDQYQRGQLIFDKVDFVKASTI